MQETLFTVLAKKVTKDILIQKLQIAQPTNGNGQGYSGTGQYPNTRTFGGSMNLTF
jgi:hypothetical protein